MSLCAFCGLDTPHGVGLCPHHHGTSHDWAVANRIMCDFFHRQRVPSRLKEADRDDGLAEGSILVQITRPSEV